MKFPGIITFSLLFILVTRIGYGQPIWSLDDCIQYALEHNIEFKRSGLNVQANEVIVLESKLLRLPSLNSSISHSYNFGRSIDPTTNDFETRSIQSNFVGLNSSIVLWNGWRQQNTLKRSKIDLEVSLEQQEGVAYNITMDVLRYYLQILVNLENVEIAKNQLALSEEQIVRTIILVDVGKLAENALLDIKAQVAADEVLLVKALNNLDLSYLDIRLLLNLELDTPFQVHKPEFELVEDDYLESIILSELHANADKTQPSIKVAKLQVKSAELGIALARSYMSPTVSFFGNIGTSYSSLTQKSTGQTFPFTQSIGYVQNTGDSVFTTINIPFFENTPLFEQMDNNLNEGYGISLSIPIFNSWQIRSNITRAKINYLDSEYILALSKQSLNKDIETAYASAKASYKNYVATLNNVVATKRSFSYTQERFDLKVITGLDYSIEKNKLTRAELDLVQAKYDYIFSIKILEFYQGRVLKF